jgi:NADH-quinone oxidoreductase subunit F
MNNTNSLNNRKILVCCGTGCLANGSMEVYKVFEKMLTGSGIKVDTEIKCTGCNGLCEKGPVVKIQPDDIAYYHVKAGDVEEIVEKTIKHGQAVERLLYLEPSTGKRILSHKDTEFNKRQRKIALRNIGEIDPSSIEDYIDHGGFKALHKVIDTYTSDDIIAEIKKSGLRGRGGAGFPTGVKWESCKNIQKYPKYVVCNGDEGDPGAFMDRSIMEGDPFSILEGMLICAYAIKAEKGFIYIRDEYSLAIKNITKAIEAARQRGYLGKNVLGSGFSFDIDIVRGGGAFVCGESTALMASIEGKVGEPHAKYIRSVEKGLWGQPTVLNNVETWVNVPEILLKGAEWFESIGTEKSKGTKVFSLVGKVINTGLVEVSMGTSLRELIFDIGGGIQDGRRFKAVQTGGPSGGCIPEKFLDLKVDFDTLTAAGSMMGSGGMIVMDDRTCMIDVARYYIKFLSEESCGKCVPCREGLKALLEILERICHGKGKNDDIRLLEEICETMSLASLCGLGKSAANPVLTTLKYFRNEYIEHIEEKKCSAGVCKDISTYHIDETACRGCTACKRACPAGAIKGEPKATHYIEQDKCIKCGSCIEVCRFNAVKTI